MSLKETSFKVHHFAQNIFPCSYFVDIEKNALVPHPLYNKKLHRRFRYLTFFGCIIAVPITSSYLLWLFTCSNSTIQKDYFVQFTLYTMISPLFIVFNYCNYLMVARCDERQYLLSQACDIFHYEDLHTNSIKIGKYTIKELFIYAFSTAFLLLILGVFIFPFVMSIDPIQLVLGNSFPVKLLCSLIYGPGSGLLFWQLLSSLLICISALEMAECYSRKLIVKQSKLQTKEYLHSLKFHKCYARYQKTRLLFDLSTVVMEKGPAIVICIGILICSISTTGTLTLWSKVNIFFYLVLPIVSLICFVIAIVVTNLAGIPYLNVLRFQKLWKKYLVKKYDRRLLRAARHFGLDMGPYGLCTRMLGLLICEDIVRNTSDLLLIM